MPVGPTLIRIHSASSAGAILSGGRTPALPPFASRAARPSRAKTAPRWRRPATRAIGASRSSRSRKRRCLKNEPFTHPTRFSTLPFVLRSIRPARFDAKTQIDPDARKRRIPFRDDSSRPHLQRNHLRPIEQRDQQNAAERRNVIDQSAYECFRHLIGTRVTSTQREYLSREAKKCTRCSVASSYYTTASPKSCEKWPGEPSKAHQRRDDAHAQPLRARMIALVPLV